jgi:hypothetical protein
MKPEDSLLCIPSQNSTFLVTVLGHINQVVTISFFVERQILIAPFHLRLYIPSKFFPSDFQSKMYFAFSFPPIQCSHPYDIQ